MATINVRRDVQDSYYRYKMPRLQSKIEGKGNGIKTVVPNMVDISRALSRPPSYATKYFGTELGAQTIIEEKKERYIVNGAHDADKLQCLLDGFIDRFVLCGACKNPETDLRIRDGIITRRCMACGKVSDVDMRHRLCTFILKHPPPKVKSNGKHASANRTGGAGDNSDGSGGGEEITADQEAEEIEAIARQLEQGANNLSLDDDQWGIDVDVSEEAVARRARELAGAFVDEEDEDATVDPYDALGDYIAEVGPDFKKIRAKSIELGLGTKYKALAVIVQVLYTEANIISQIKKSAPFLQSFGDSEKHQKAILGGFERVIGEQHPELLAKTALIMKTLYDEDLVEEDVFIAWAAKPSKKYVDRETAKKIRTHADRFITWLKEADDEDSETEFE